MALENNRLQNLTLDPLKFLGRLPEFSGNRKDLYSFISLVDRVNPLLIQYDELSQLLFFDLIKTKLKGKAKETIEINFHAQSWAEIRTILINTFGEKFNTEELYDRLRSVVFKTNAINFYNEIKDKLRSLNNKTSTDLGINLNSEQIARNNMRTALKIFREKIPEPMKTILACRNPDTIEKAMDILFSSGYANYNSDNNLNFKNKPHATNNKNYQANKDNVVSQNFYQKNNQSYPRCEARYSKANTSKPSYNGRHQYNNGNFDNNNNRTNFTYSHNRQRLNNSFPNSQNGQQFSEPMDINVMQNSENLLELPICQNNAQINISNNPQDPDYNRSVHSPFQSTLETYSIPQNISTTNSQNNAQNSNQILPNENATAQNFPFQASVGNYHI